MNSTADQQLAGAAPEAPSFTYEEVKGALEANHANTLALLECLRQAMEPRPFREAEEAVAGGAYMGVTMQTPHALYDILLAHGAVEAIAVPEEAPEVATGDADSEGVLPDQPVDYLLATTELGRRALEEFEPTKRFAELLAAEPKAYGPVYGQVLDLCIDGASKDVIETALQGQEALQFPKQIYPGYFISKLETIDGISWDGLWRTTEPGQRMRALLA